MRVIFCQFRNRTKLLTLTYSDSVQKEEERKEKNRGKNSSHGIKYILSSYLLQGVIWTKKCIKISERVYEPESYMKNLKVRALNWNFTGYNLKLREM